MRSSFLLLAASTGASASLFQSFKEVNGSLSYDFVIVGAGPGGASVANRLTEDANTTVLLIEAGGANEGDLNVDIPLMCTRLTPMTQYDWNYTTTAQSNLHDRVLPFPRGIGLGGSSAVNCLLYTRGSSQDIDRWAALSGDESWGWDALLPYFMKSEKFNLPVDGHDVSGQYDPSVHGTEGFIGVSVPGAGRGIDDRVVNTTQELDEFPFRLDMNSGDQLGVGWAQALIDRGVRSSSKAYLTAEVLARPNLDVVLNTRVSRVLETTNGTLDFRTVELFDDADQEFKNLTANKEVILSAGAVATPQILLLSGIGNSTLLESLSINTLVDLPSVGQNLTDHIGVSSTWRVNSTRTLDTIIRNETLEDALVEQWIQNKTGILVDTSENHAAFLRLPENSTVWDSFEDPSAGNSSAHIEFLFQNGLSNPKPEGNFMNIPVANVSPLSRGSVSINSTDPFAHPLIDLQLLSEPVDIVILREAIKSSRRFFTAKAWDGYLLEALNTAETDDEIDEYIRKNAVSFFHPVATAAMSPVGATWGVVDPDLKVKGVTGLRIVDASVAPSLPAAHTSAAVYAIGERAADIIKQGLGLNTTLSA
jgi:choline dehydrogenase-like flavoprotein